MFKKLKFKQIKTALQIIKTFKNWPLFFLLYFRIIKKKTAVFKFRNGLVWHVNAGKRGFGVIGDVCIKNPYKHLLEQKNPKVIIDLGGHIGTFSVLAAKKFPKTKIYTYEASKENFKLLLKNMKANNVKNVHAFNVGVSNKNGSFTFYINKRNTILNSFDPTVQKDWESSHKVKCKTLKTIFKENNIKECDILKIDIEGMEYSVIEAAMKDKLKIKNISAEVHPRLKEHNKLKKLLKANGYNITVRNIDIVNGCKI